MLLECGETRPETSIRHRIPISRRRAHRRSKPPKERIRRSLKRVEAAATSSCHRERAQSSRSDASRRKRVETQVGVQKQYTPQARKKRSPGTTCATGEEQSRVPENRHVRGHATSRQRTMGPARPQQYSHDGRAPEGAIGIAGVSLLPATGVHAGDEISDVLQGQRRAMGRLSAGHAVPDDARSRDDAKPPHNLGDANES